MGHFFVVELELDLAFDVVQYHREVGLLLHFEVLVDIVHFVVVVGVAVNAEHVVVEETQDLVLIELGDGLVVEHA